MMEAGLVILPNTGYKRKIGFEGGQMPLQRRVPKAGYKRKIGFEGGQMPLQRRVPN